MKPPCEVGRVLRAFRARHQLKQGALAYLVGTGLSHISEIELGKQGLTPRMLAKIRVGCARELGAEAVRELDALEAHVKAPTDRVCCRKSFDLPWELRDWLRVEARARRCSMSAVLRRCIRDALPALRALEPCQDGGGRA